MRAADFIPAERMGDVAFLLETPGGRSLFAGIKEQSRRVLSELKRGRVGGGCAAEATLEYQLGIVEGLAFAEALASAAKREVGNGR